MGTLRTGKLEVRQDILSWAPHMVLKYQQEWSLSAASVVSPEYNQLSHYHTPHSMKEMDIVKAKFHKLIASVTEISGYSG